MWHISNAGHPPLKVRCNDKIIDFLPRMPVSPEDHEIDIRNNLGETRKSFEQDVLGLLIFKRRHIQKVPPLGSC